ncbi:MAG TPA: hypothetical protein DDW43_02680 [Nitrosomonas sp.]|nr:hypothetical protein [Nitrosomonas sp.]
MAFSIIKGAIIILNINEYTSKRTININAIDITFFITILVVLREIVDAIDDADSPKKLFNILIIIFFSLI